MELAQIRAARDVVVLVAFVPLQLAQLHPLRVAFEEIGVVVRVRRRDQNHVNIGPVGCLEVCQPEDQLPVFLLVDRRTA